MRQFRQSHLPTACNLVGSRHGAIMAGCGGAAAAPGGLDPSFDQPGFRCKIGDFAHCAAILATTLHRNGPCKDNRVQSDPGNTVGHLSIM
jgi:hypothetical protein